MDQFTVISSHSQTWMPVLKKDPVRPNITPMQRIASNRECFVVHEDIIVKAVLCCSYIGAIPKTEADILADWNDFSIACFYSVWSNQKGYGKYILDRAMTHISWNKLRVCRALTLSPKTDMARKFHLGNGAYFLQENEETINYEYPLSKF